MSSSAQSFTLADKPIAQERISRLQRQIRASDESGSTVETDIDFALNSLVNQEAVFGYHHFSLLCLSRDLAGLDKAVAELGSCLTDMNINWLREDLNMEASFWAQLPGNHAYIARSCMLSSANFSGLSSMHNFATGRASGVHWGLPISILETTSQTPYWFNFHQRDIGHFLVTGPTGSGKTVVLTFLLAQAFRISPEPRAVFFDKDRGAEIFVRAVGGAYEVLQPGVATGFNPLQLENNPTNREFLIRLLKAMLPGRRQRLFPRGRGHARTGDRPHLPGAGRAAHACQSVRPPDGSGARRRQRSAVTAAALVRGREGLALQRAARRPVVLGSAHLRLRHDAHPGQPGGAHAGADVPLSPARRAAHRRAGPDLHGRGLEAAPGPGLSPSYIVDKMKTIRKLNGIVGFGTQSAADIARAPQSHTLIEQSATNIHFPNPRADEESYIRRFGLTAKEYNFIRNTPPERRTFLIKHGNDFVIARLDLSAMPDIVQGAVGPQGDGRDLRGAACPSW